MYFIVYKITNKIYIGVHRTTNINDSYMGSGTILKRSRKKYGTCWIYSNIKKQSKKIPKDEIKI